MAYEEGDRPPEAPQNIILESRRRLSVSAVRDVESFDEDAVIMHTSKGALLVHGEGLRLEKLSLDSSKVIVEGNIRALEDEEPDVPSGGFFARLFRCWSIPYPFSCAPRCSPLASDLCATCGMIASAFCAAYRVLFTVLTDCLFWLVAGIGLFLIGFSFGGEQRLYLSIGVFFLCGALFFALQQTLIPLLHGSRAGTGTFYPDFAKTDAVFEPFFEKSLEKGKKYLFFSPKML